MEEEKRQTSKQEPSTMPKLNPIMDNPSLISFAKSYIRATNRVYKSKYYNEDYLEKCIKIINNDKCDFLMFLLKDDVYKELRNALKYFDNWNYDISIRYTDLIHVLCYPGITNYFKNN